VDDKDASKSRLNSNGKAVWEEKDQPRKRKQQ